MRTFLTDIFPKIQRFSNKLDNLTLLTNQHWVSIDDILSTKTIYIFRTNNELLISENGKVEKAKWEHLGNKSILIDKSNDSYLFKQGFLDENVLALKVDTSKEYAVFVNENKYDGELNSFQKVIDFLTLKYFDTHLNNNKQTINEDWEKPQNSSLSYGTSATYKTKQGMLTLTGQQVSKNKKIIIATLDGRTAPDGRYRLEFMWHVTVQNGLVI